MINVIVGPPCAGKSEHVKAKAKEGHVIIDYDLIARAMGSRAEHDAAGSVRIVALESRKSAIKRIINGLDDDAWVIHTNPRPQVLQSYVGAGAEFTLIDPGKSECLRRAKASGRPASTIDAIEAWYANPPVLPANKKQMGAAMHRAYSLLTIKQVDDDQRIIAGVATTPTPDRIGDVVEPLGARFKNPLPLLWHHDSTMPVGEVTLAKPTKDGIRFTAKFPRVDEPPSLKERIEVAWAEVKAGLLRGVSIGFRELEHAIMESGGIRFIATELLELSLVTIPANAQATIHLVKSLDAAQRAASGRSADGSAAANPAGVSAPRQPVTLKEGTAMKTLAEQISAFEDQRTVKADRLMAIQQKALDENRSKNEGEVDEFEDLSREIETIDKELIDLRRLETINATKAHVIKPADNPTDGAAQRGGHVDVGAGSSIVVKTRPKLDDGIEFARRVKVAVMAMKNPRWREAEIAAAMYGGDSEVAAYYKAAVPAGTTLAGNWGANLVSPEGAAVAAFMEFLRPATILGKFGTGGIPALNEIPFRAPLVSETGAGAAWWVGEGAAKPVTKGAFTRDRLEPTKLANICVLSMENIRDSSPKSDIVIRNMLRAAIVQEQDYAFINPANAGTANIKPASVTNGAEAIASSGDDAAAIRLDVRSLIAKFTAADNPPSSGVWVMSSASAAALGTMMNPLGQPEFSGVSMTGGTFFMMPVIVSDVIGRPGPNGQAAVPEIVALVNARDIFLAEDDGIQIDQSDQVSLQMDDAPTMSSAAPTATSVVSMWQTNSVAIRAEHTINWKRGRSSAVAYLTGVSWGGEVNTA